MNQSLSDRWAFRPGVMLRHVIFIALCVPMFTLTESEYAPNFVLTNFFALLFLAGAVFSRRLDWSRKNVFGYALTGMLLLANVFALYFNWKYHKWYMGQVHLTISFLTFIVLCFFREDAPAEDWSLLRFLVGMIILTDALALIVNMLGYWRVDFMNNRVTLVKEQAFSGFPWIYLHKSQFSCALILFLALFTTYRQYFQRKWLFWAGICVLTIDLILTNAYTSMVAAMFIPIGLVLDRLFAKHRFRPKYLLWLIPFAAVGLALYSSISTHRNIATLGNRTNIWVDALRVIRDYPAGFGVRAGKFSFQELGYETYAFNCHNVFLNWMFQLSLPAGFFVNAMFFTILAVSIKRNPSFTTLGIWVALLLPMNMDWCVLPMELTMTLLCIYLIFFSPLRKAAPAEAGAK